MNLEQSVINPEQAKLDEVKDETRKQELLTSNIKYQLIGELRKAGAIKINIDAFERKNDEIKVKAKYELKGYKQSEFLFKENHMHNFVIKGFDLSLDNAQLVQVAEYKTTPITTEDNITFDLSIIQAKEIDYNKYQISYPTVGEIGTLNKESLTEDIVKRLCGMSAANYGLKPVFSGDFKVSYNVDPEFASVKSPDGMHEAQKQLRSFLKENNDLKEKDKFSSLRENLITTLETQAKNIVKSNTTSYRTGSTKILATDSMLEYIDNKFDGKIFVKALIGKDVISYGIPVVKNNLIVKGGLEVYKEKREDYVNEVQDKINLELAESMNKEMAMAKADYEVTASEEAMKLNKVLAYKASDMQKKILVDKNWLPTGTVNGMILNLKGINYKVEFEENNIMCNLVLQES
jgi:hypothetical protein